MEIRDIRIFSFHRHFIFFNIHTSLLACFFAFISLLLFPLKVLGSAIVYGCTLSVDILSETCYFLSVITMKTF